MFRSILASITLYSIVFFSVGQTAIALPQANLAETNRTEVESCATCSATTNPLDRLATLGRQTKNVELLPIARSQVKGIPIESVSSSTGEIAFAQTDLAFKDNPLLVFQRTYISNRNEDFGLGRGWSFAFNDSIALNDDNAVLTTATGDNFTYRRSAANHYVLQTSDSTDVKEFNVENGNSISAKNGNVIKIYKRSSGNGDYYLSQITAPGGFEVIINRNPNGNIRRISSISGEINFDWSNGNSVKLLAVTDNTGRRISLAQSNGSLLNVTTPTGGKWQYAYAGGKISNVLDPANRIALRAEYDASGRASKIGDAAGLNHFTYETNANNVSTRTTFTDSLNYARVFQHNEGGILTRVSDAQGTLLSIQYDESNQPTQITKVNGATATFEYDAQKRLTRQVTAEGSEKVFEYMANGKLKAIIENGERVEIVYDEANLTETRIGRNGKKVKSSFNHRGQESRLQIEGGLTLDFEFDGKGRKTADVYSDIGRFERTFDAAGRKTSEKSPSGFTRSYEYDANNQVVRQSDNRGHSGRVERDASGNLTKIITSNTDWIQISRDEAGRIVQLTNSLGQSRRYTYNSRGALTRFIGADGRDLLFQYNERGEMQSVINAQNAGLIYQRNRGGKVAKLQQNAGQKNIWQIQKINYTKTSANLSIDGFCAFDDPFYFGGDSGWMDSWGSSGSIFEVALFGGSCYDPFGDLFGGGGGGFGGGETCFQCRQRESNNCQNDYRTTMSNNAVALAGGTVACIALAVGATPLTGLLCQAIVSGATVNANNQAANSRDNCLANVASKCESKCN